MLLVLQKRVYDIEATGELTAAEVGAVEAGLILKEEDCGATTGVAKIEAPAEDTICAVEMD